MSRNEGYPIEGIDTFLLLLRNQQCSRNDGYPIKGIEMRKTQNQSF